MAAIRVLEEQKRLNSANNGSGSQQTFDPFIPARFQSANRSGGSRKVASVSTKTTPVTAGTVARAVAARQSSANAADSSGAESSTSGRNHTPGSSKPL
jgi:hypothetical protein